MKFHDNTQCRSFILYSCLLFYGCCLNFGIFCTDILLAWYSRYQYRLLSKSLQAALLPANQKPRQHTAVSLKHFQQSWVTLNPDVFFTDKEPRYGWILIHYIN